MSTVTSDLNEDTQPLNPSTPLIANPSPDIAQCVVFAIGVEKELGSGLYFDSAGECTPGFFFLDCAALHPGYRTASLPVGQRCAVAQPTLL